MKRRLITYAILVFMLLPSIAFAATQEMKEYKVIKGDTLWDIAKKELKDPFMWPNIWKANRWISNPNLIYPNKIIKIPRAYVQKEKSDKDVAMPAQEEVVTEPAPVVKKTPIVDKNIIMASGYIADTIASVGQVLDSPSEKTLFGNEDKIYVDLDNTPQVGKKFYVIKTSGPVEHPITGKDAGYIVMISGIIEILKVDKGETLAKITKCFREIERGDRIISYYDIEPPMTTGDFRSPNINGMIIAAKKYDWLQSMVLDVVYLDKGCKDGIKVGDKFRSIAVDTHAIPNGVIKVISCRDYTATAIIEYSNAPVTPGNIFTKLDK